MYFQKQKIIIIEIGAVCNSVDAPVISTGCGQSKTSANWHSDYFKFLFMYNNAIILNVIATILESIAEHELKDENQ